MAKTQLTPPLKWHGGKHDLAKWIISHFPARCLNPNKPDESDGGYLHYVEPYFGGGSVLLANDPEGISEVVNDLHAELTNFWRVLRVWTHFTQFKQMCEATEFSQPVWNEARERLEESPCSPASPRSFDDQIERAWAFFVFCRQSHSGRMKNFPPMVRARTRRGMQDHVSAWLSCIDGLPAVHKRLQRVAILHGPAVDVIRKQDGPRTLFYLDPPYLHETRATTGEYQHEMSEAGHNELLRVISGIKGRFVLSGYPSALYDQHAKQFGWRCVTTEINNHAAGGRTKRRMTECLWLNY